MVYSFVSLGSNIGDRIGALDSAVHELSEKIDIVKKSGIVETSAWGLTAQPRFLNMVLLSRVSITPFELLEVIHTIESSMGRRRNGIKWSARTIDIDILTYGSYVIRSGKLFIPHPHLHERDFVLKPFSEIAPEYVAPGFYDSIIELKESLNEDN